ncbi:alpha/beta hydrolase [Rhodococcus sp. T2V]|nr:alpha/beta hydrolase [Rhodococcus sp. T2V]MDF3307172.1 alpha/beta hydrolase [Rhodococcus sp. T2V]
MEFLKILGPLTDPVAFGGKPEDAFHVVVPSIPGFAWSGHTMTTGWHPGRISAAFAQLMQGLGYDRFGAFGTDLGSPINIELALSAPSVLSGIYLTLIPSGLQPLDGVLTPAEQALMAANDRKKSAEIGYVALQSSKPQTLAYALSDSPVAQAAWIVEKLRSWTDCGGDLESALTKDEILMMVCAPWFTATGGSSARAYYEMARYFAQNAGNTPTRVEVPTGVGVFPFELYPTSRRIASDHFNIVHWTDMPAGGHFAAMEQPSLLVADIRKFFSTSR